MPRVLRLRRPSHSTVVAYLGLFVALGGTGAYAANTIGSSDIIDGSIGSADVKDNSLNTFDVHSFIGEDIIDGTVTGADVANTSSLGSSDIGEEGLLFNNTLVASDLATGSVGTDEVQNDSLTGADINEASLAPSTTIAFANPGAAVPLGTNVFTHIVSRTVPAGSYAVWAVGNLTITASPSSDQTLDTICELRSNGNWIGSATDRRTTPEDQAAKVSLAPNGGTSFGAGGGTISLWCLAQNNGNRFEYGHMLIQRVDGFF
jgi:hypothetical protein